MTMIIEIVVREKVHQLKRLLLSIHIMRVHIYVCVGVRVYARCVRVTCSQLRVSVMRARP